MSAGQKRPKNAAPFAKKIKEHELGWFVDKYEKIFNALSPQLEGTSNSKKYLAQVVAYLQQGMEDLYGAKSDDRTMTKLPISLFRDFSVGGSLMVILQTALDYKNEESWRSDGFQRNLSHNPKRHILLFENIKAALEAQGHLAPNRIFFNKAVPAKEVEQLTKIVKNHGGVIVDNPKEATHIIIPDQTNYDDESSDWLRTLENRDIDKINLVHWWYYPDSYDEWFPAAEVEGEAGVPLAHKGSWTVTTRFLKDLDIYNEWMNEEDYVDDDDDTPDEKKNTPTRPRRDRKKRVVQEIMEEEPRPAARPTPNPKPPQPKSTPKTPAEKSGGGASAQKAPSERPRSSATPATVSSQHKQNQTFSRPPVRSLPSETIYIPASSAWFDIEAIHEQETENFPDFFNGTCPSKTPDTYKLARNSMIKLYRSSPREYLTATECRRHIVSDVVSINRLHSYLQDIGLINYRVHDRPTKEIPSTLQQILFLNPQGQVKGARTKSQLGALLPNLKFRKSSLLQLDPTGEREEVGGEPPVMCTACAAATRVRYTNASHSLCPRCYAAAKFPTELTHADFKKVVLEEGVEKRGGGWTEGEVVRLLEAIEIYGNDDWNSVAHVVGKSPADCLSHFVSLPIDDNFRDDSTLAGRKRSGHLALPLADETRIFAQIASLCSSVSPAAVQEATETFMSATTSENKKRKTETDVEMQDVPTEVQKPADDNVRTNGSSATAGDRRIQESLAKAAGLASAAVKAKDIAKTEESEIKRLLHEALNLQLTKLEARLKHFREMEDVLAAEHHMIEVGRRAVLSGQQ